MLIADMLHSCSNDKVAQAALACIGGLFAERVDVVAKQHGLTAGRFVSLVVRDFSRRADVEAHATLGRWMAGADQPLLRGLRHILEPALEKGALVIDDSAVAFDPQIVGSPACSGVNKYH